MPPMTNLTKRATIKKATKIVSLMPDNLPSIYNAIGTVDTNIADGAVVTATRVDAAGNASGTALNDDRGNVYATFAGALAESRDELKKRTVREFRRALDSLCECEERGIETKALFESFATFVDEWQQLHRN